MSPSFGDITEEEVDTVVALWRDCGLARPWNDPFRDIALARASPTSSVIVARGASGAILGTVMTGFDGHRGWVYYLAVAAAARDQGLGRALMAEAERRLSALGAPKLQLMVRHENTTARGFYERLGYEPQETSVFGRWIKHPGAIPPVK